MNCFCNKLPSPLLYSPIKQSANGKNNLVSTIFKSLHVCINNKAQETVHVIFEKLIEMGDRPATCVIFSQQITTYFLCLRILPTPMQSYCLCFSISFFAVALAVLQVSCMMDITLCNARPPSTEGTNTLASKP